MQNENGPCPLLAAANALLLKGVISLPSESIRNGVASIDDVVNVLAERALTSAAGDDSAHHLHELLTIFPKLQFGMDVNPKFTEGPTGVEYTTNLTAFDMLNVELVHGWLLDPQDEDMFKLVEKKTYNQLIEVVVQGNEASSELEQLEKIRIEKEKQVELLDKEEEGWVNVASDSVSEEDAKVVAAVDDASPAVSVVTPSAAKDDKELSEETASPVAEEETLKTEQVVEAKEKEAADCKQEESADEAKGDETADSLEATYEAVTEETGESKESQESDLESLTLEEKKKRLVGELDELREKRDELIHLATNGSLINSFLSSTSHQLTHYGLHELYSYVEEESLSVFFRNNHFGTLTKQTGVLYLLVTDLGYANVPEVMWEKLDGIDGDTEYVNAAFQKPAPQAELAPAAGPTLSPEEVLAQRGQSEADLQLAIELSKHSNHPNKMDEEEGRLVAAATEASLRTYNGIEEEESKTEEVSPEESISLPASGIIDGCSTQEDSDKLMAMQLQAEMEKEDASLSLARKLQMEESQRARKGNAQPAGADARRKQAASSNCVVS